jgi:hypothetical protein
MSYEPCIVVALLDPLGELTGLRQQPADARHRVGAEQRERQGLVHVPRELVRTADPVDLEEVDLRVELLDTPQPVEALHGADTKVPHQKGQR